MGYSNSPKFLHIRFSWTFDTLKPFTTLPVWMKIALQNFTRPIRVVCGQLHPCGVFAVSISAAYSHIWQLSVRHETSHQVWCQQYTAFAKTSASQSRAGLTYVGRVWTVLVGLPLWKIPSLSPLYYLMNTLVQCSYTTAASIRFWHWRGHPFPLLSHFHPFPCRLLSRPLSHFPTPDLAIHYTTFMGLIWRLRVVYWWASPL